MEGWSSSLMEEWWCTRLSNTFLIFSHPCHPPPKQHFEVPHSCWKVTKRFLMDLWRHSCPSCRSLSSGRKNGIKVRSFKISHWIVELITLRSLPLCSGITLSPKVSKTHQKPGASLAHRWFLRLPGLPAPSCRPHGHWSSLARQDGPRNEQMGWSKNGRCTKKANLAKVHDGKIWENDDKL